MKFDQRMIFFFTVRLKIRKLAATSSDGIPFYSLSCFSLQKNISHPQILRRAAQARAGDRNFGVRVGREKRPKTWRRLRSFRQTQKPDVLRSEVPEFWKLVGDDDDDDDDDDNDGDDSDDGDDFNWSQNWDKFDFWQLLLISDEVFRFCWPNLSHEECRESGFGSCSNRNLIARQIFRNFSAAVRKFREGKISEKNSGVGDLTGSVKVGRLTEFETAMTVATTTTTTTTVAGKIGPRNPRLKKTSGAATEVKNTRGGRRREGRVETRHSHPRWTYARARTHALTLSLPLPQSATHSHARTLPHLSLSLSHTVKRLHFTN